MYEANKMCPLGLPYKNTRYEVRSTMPEDKAPDEGFSEFIK